MAKKKNEVVGSAATPESRRISASPDDASIAALAYQLWLARGCLIGSDQEDWFLAESMLKSASKDELTSAGGGTS
jgi:hypothetical protein